MLVIGGGASGLSAAGALAKRRISALVLERDEHLGASWARRYERLRLHTVRRFSGLAHHPIGGERPRYLSKDDYAAYLLEYAAALRLDVSLGECVRTVRRADDGAWEVETNHGTRRAPAAVIATGHYAEPRLPTWEGQADFAGTVLHSAAFSSGAVWSGRRALVIGLGNSGAEIAADLAEQGAASVSVSVRTSPPIVTRELFGLVPVQLFGIALTPVPLPAVIDRIGGALRRIGLGDLSRHGLGEAAWGPFTARRPAVIDTGFLAQLRRGAITVRPDVRTFEHDAVVYADGAREHVDVVVAATGFDTGLGRIIRVPGVLDAAGQPTARSGGPTAAPGLYFVGFDETVRGHLFEAKRDSLRVAVEIERYLAGRGT